MSKGRILVVEDERIVAMDICQTLEDYGFSVTSCVTTGEDAVKAAAREQPDLVLMDIRLAGKIDGLEATRRIQQQAWTPTIFLTAFGEQGLVAQAKDIDAFGFILKPFEERKLCVDIDMAMTRIQVERRLRQAIHVESPSVNVPVTTAPFFFKTFGGLQLQVDGRVVLRSEQLSKTQRNLLGLLLSAPLNRVALDEVLSALWPDSSPAKARSSFDSLMLRTRKSLEKVLPNGHPEDLLVVKRSILMLLDCQIDLMTFEQLWQDGLAHYKRRSLAAAEQAFRAAVELARGPFLPAVTDLDPVACRRNELQRMFSDCHLCLGEIYGARGDVTEAIQAVEQVVGSAPLNDTTIRRVVGLCHKLHASATLRKALERYRDTLLAQGHSSKEAELMVAVLRAPDAGAE